MFLIYKDTPERLGTPPDSDAIAERDEAILQGGDLRRFVDYLKPRTIPATPLRFCP